MDRGLFTKKAVLFGKVHTVAFVVQVGASGTCKGWHNEAYATVWKCVDGMGFIAGGVPNDKCVAGCG